MRQQDRYRKNKQLFPLRRHDQSDMKHARFGGGLTPEEYRRKLIREWGAQA